MISAEFFHRGVDPRIETPWYLDQPGLRGIQPGNTRWNCRHSILINKNGSLPQPYYPDITIKAEDEAIRPRFCGVSTYSLPNEGPVDRRSALGIGEWLRVSRLEGPLWGNAYSMTLRASRSFIKMDLVTVSSRICIVLIRDIYNLELKWMADLNIFQAPCAWSLYISPDSLVCNAWFAEIFSKSIRRLRYSWIEY